MIPLRADHPHELSAFAQLTAKLDGSYPDGGRETLDFFNSYAALFGRPDHIDLSTAYETLGNIVPNNPTPNDTWAKILQAIAAKLTSPATVADTLRLPGKSSAPSFRILAASALPDAIYFDQILSANARPTGIDLAAYLGSPWAIAEKPAGLKTSAYQGLKAAADPDNYRYRYSNLYENYLDLLRTLFQPPEPDAPAFMANPAWQKKSLQTALGSWAQIRHTFTLQTKITVHYLGIGPQPIGFVEPNPVFFSKAAHFISSLKQFLIAQDVLALTAKDSARHLRELADKLAKASTEEDRIHTGTDLFTALQQLEKQHPDWLKVSLGIDDTEAAAKKAATQVREYASILENSPSITLLEDPNRLQARWDALETLSHQLASLCQKQLRQQPFNSDDNRILKSYGETLAFIMGYFGNSYLHPRDDAPRWAEIVNYPTEKKSLAIGIGRPRLLNILYPWQGTEILCEGAITTYYEYDADKRLTDPEWSTLLQSPQAPAQPAWLSPLTPKP